MKQLRIDPPNDKQKIALKARAKHIGYGGARGGGKSWLVRTKAKLLGLRYAGIKMLIVRRTLEELRNNHINPLRAETKDIAKYNKQEKMFNFQNGSSLQMGYCDNENDLLQYQGAEYDVIFLEEATQLREEWIKIITACLRGANSFPKRIYYTFNPGGVSHGYIKRLFIDKRYEAHEKPEDYVFIQSLVTDNKILMQMQPDYVTQLETLPPKLKQAWLYGRWDVFEGQFFEDFRTEPDPIKCEEAGITPDEARSQHRWTHVIQPIDLTKGAARGWNIMRSYDWGYNKPFSVGYWAIDYDGTLYRILEFYGWNGNPNEGNKWTTERQFQEIATFERTHPWLKNREIIDSVADPSIWDASKGESVADTAARYGIYFTPGDNARIPGWMQVHNRLKFDENGYARMYIFENCKTFIRTIPLMMYSKTNPEDLDTSLEDHCADEVRYMCMSRPVEPALPAVREVILSDPLDQFKDY